MEEAEVEKLRDEFGRQLSMLSASLAQEYMVNGGEDLGTLSSRWWRKGHEDGMSGRRFDEAWVRDAEAWAASVSPYHAQRLALAATHAALVGVSLRLETERNGLVGVAAELQTGTEARVYGRGRHLALGGLFVVAALLFGMAEVILTAEAAGTVFGLVPPQGASTWVEVLATPRLWPSSVAALALICAFPLLTLVYEHAYALLVMARPKGFVRYLAAGSVAVLATLTTALLGDARAHAFRRAQVDPYVPIAGAILFPMFAGLLLSEGLHRLGAVRAGWRLERAVARLGVLEGLLSEVRSLSTEWTDALVAVQAALDRFAHALIAAYRSGYESGRSASNPRALDEALALMASDALRAAHGAHNPALTGTFGP